MDKRYSLFNEAVREKENTFIALKPRACIIKFITAILYGFP
jgi:hypothetical protein